MSRGTEQPELATILFRSLATSALAAVALWIFFSFFIGFASDLAADALACLPKPRRRQAPVKHPCAPEEIVANRRVAAAASLFSLAVLYSPATSTILDPCLRPVCRLPAARQAGVGTGRRQAGLPAHPQQPGADGSDGAAVAGTLPEPLAPGPVDSGGGPYLTLLAALTLLCFGLSYVVFMRQEIRSV